MNELKHIRIKDYDYELPDSFIAQNPLKTRDEAKLLIYRQGEIEHSIFNKLPKLLPHHSRLVLNNAKVIPARLQFYRATGAKIEVFLLEPKKPFPQIELALAVKDHCIWQCMIGNLKKWKDDEILTIVLKNEECEITLEAKLYDREKQWVELSWEGGLPFTEILQLAGKLPLPPYIKREANKNDETTYQTVFAKEEGAVAAPTAGLHFSKAVFSELALKEINQTDVTLYVGAGTFAPVSVENMLEHDMHAEIISVSIEAIDELLEENYRIAVGTTSLRTLESLYWIGVKLFNKDKEPFIIEKLYPYSDFEIIISWNESLEQIKKYLTDTHQRILAAQTAIMIMPGYNFRSVKALITNFHHPKTTLIMLVAAFIGDDWKKVYQSAIENNYRFLSYGDSSLLYLNE